MKYQKEFWKLSRGLGHGFIMLGLFTALCLSFLQGFSAPKTSAFGTSEVIELSNRYRSDSGLAPLSTNQYLTTSAQAKADDMASRAYFAHEAPDGTTPWSFFKTAGYEYITAGENLALTNESAASVVDGWFNSPGHRANLLSTNFTEVGYGIAYVPSFSYNGITYDAVYLVAAHYGEPVVAVSSAADPETAIAVGAITPVNSPLAEQAKLQPSTQPDSIPIADQAPSTDDTSNEHLSGAAVIVTKKAPVIPRDVQAGLIGVSIVSVLIGLALELRRLLRHESILPHLHGQHHF